MSEGDWLPRTWEGDDDGRERLPRLEELPVAEQGYDRRAVEQAFQSFYRHAAQLDSTLRLLASMETFQRQAGELRADLRALRAASWGPVPSRPAWSDAYRTTSYRVSSGAEGGLAGAWPRLALEAAFILLVAGGAALADLRTTVVVLLVLAAWALVGLTELVASAVRVRAPGPSPPVRQEAGPAVAELPPLAEQPPPGEDTEPDLESAEESQPLADEARPEQESEQEREPASSEPSRPKRRFRRRRGDAGDLAAEQGRFEVKHVRVLPAGDPWERGPELPPEDPEQEEAASETAGAATELEPAEEAHLAEPKQVIETEPPPPPVADEPVAEQPQRALGLLRRRGREEPPPEPVAESEPEPEPAAEPEPLPEVVEPEPAAISKPAASLTLERRRRRGRR